MTLKILNQVIHNEYNKPKADFLLVDIDYACCVVMKLPSDMIYIKTRKREIVQVRQTSIALRQILKGQSQPSIAREFGRMNHSTCAHCKKVFLERYSIYHDYRETIRDILFILGLPRNFFDDLQ
jgi:chromosomal replication initiator protein